MEIWKNIEGYEGYYLISNLGRIKSLSRVKSKGENILKEYFGKDGYSQAKLSKQGKSTTVRIHRILAQSFLKKVDGKKHVNHKDGVKSNNKLENLEWCTNKENAIHAHKTGLCNIKGEKNPFVKISKNEVLQIRDLFGYYDAVELAEIYGLSERHTKSIISRMYWKHI